MRAHIEQFANINQVQCNILQFNGNIELSSIKQTNCKYNGDILGYETMWGWEPLPR